MFIGKMDTRRFITLALCFSLTGAIAQPGSLRPDFGTAGTVIVKGGFNRTGYCSTFALTPEGKIITAGGTYSDGPGWNAVVQFTADGFLDNTFGDRGVADSVTGRHIALQTDGKILLDGSYNAYNLVRCTADGHPDPTFNPQTLASTPDFIPMDMVVQPDGKIIRAGSAFPIGPRFVLIRLLPDGSPDVGFGAGGAVITDFPDETNEHLTDIILQPNGKIIAVGWYLGTDGAYHILAARYNTNGTRDFTFGTNGAVRSSFGPETSQTVSVGLTSDGKILIAGNNGSSIGVLRLSGAGNPDNTFGTNGIAFFTPEQTASQARPFMVLARTDGKILVSGDWTATKTFPFCVQLNSDGSPDDTFDARLTLKKYEIDPYPGYPVRIALRPDGHLLLSTRTMAFQFVLLQFDTIGTADPAFGDQGRARGIFQADAQATQIQVLPNDKILVLGNFIDSISSILLTQFTPDGQPDPAFGNQGKVFATVTPKGGNSSTGLAVQSDGKILVANFDPKNEYSSRASLLRFLANGAPDSSFAVNGVLSLAGLFNFSSAKVQLQPDGKILLLANKYLDNYTYAILYRFLPSGAKDATFGANGTVSINAVKGDEIGYALGLSPDGKITVAGIADEGLASNYFEVFVSRFNPDGTPDNSFGVNGRTVPPIPQNTFTVEVADVLIQPDGSTLVCGSLRYGGDFYNSDMLLLRLLPNGDLDDAFGSNGIFVGDVFGGGDKLSGLALQADGKIIACGSAWGIPSDISIETYANKSLIVRFLPDGTPDPDFGLDGYSSGYFNNPEIHSLADVALQSDGTIVAAGKAMRTYCFEMALCAYQSKTVGTTSVPQAIRFVRVFPNPVQDRVEMEFTRMGAGVSTIRVYDAVGHIVCSLTSNTPKPAGLQREILDVRDLPAGQYVVEIRAGQERFAGKFVKN